MMTLAANCNQIAMIRIYPIPLVFKHDKILFSPIAQYFCLRFLTVIILGIPTPFFETSSPKTEGSAKNIDGLNQLKVD